MEWNSLFRLFGSGSNVTIFSLGAGGYLQRADYAKIRDWRDRVFAWAPGNQVKQDTWTIPKQGMRDDLLYICNSKLGEYMYSIRYVGMPMRVLGSS